MANVAFGWLFNIVERGRASYDRVTAFLSEKAEIDDIPDALDVNAKRGYSIIEIEEFKFPR